MNIKIRENIKIDSRERRNESRIELLSEYNFLRVLLLGKLAINLSTLNTTYLREEE